MLRSKVGGVTAALTLLLGASSALAAGLEPKSASQIVQLRTFGTECPGLGGGHVIDLRTDADGSTTPGYVIPPKHVLVVRRVRFDATPGAGAGVVVQLQLAEDLVAYSIGTGDTTPGLANGHYQGTFEFDPGLVVRNLSDLCIITQSLASPFATAVGFLAKDK
jgi:hypothetical protein